VKALLGLLFLAWLPAAGLAGVSNDLADPFDDAILLEAVFDLDEAAGACPLGGDGDPDPAAVVDYPARDRLHQAFRSDLNPVLLPRRMGAQGATGPPGR